MRDIRCSCRSQVVAYATPLFLLLDSHCHPMLLSQVVAYATRLFFLDSHCHPMLLCQASIQPANLA
uniref:Uncharacterized protein n=1 Tax=Salix viminalis TaxID=40686 RepID=A0A6N2MVC0_SALVM